MASDILLCLYRNLCLSRINCEATWNTMMPEASHVLADCNPPETFRGILLPMVVAEHIPPQQSTRLRYIAKTWLKPLEVEACEMRAPFSLCNVIDDNSNASGDVNACSRCID